MRIIYDTKLGMYKGFHGASTCYHKEKDKVMELLRKATYGNH